MERCTVFVDGKSLVRYLLALLYKFNIEKCGTVRVAARGRFISKAVTSVLSLLNLLHHNYAVSHISIGTVVLRSSSAEKHVSKIEIVVANMERVP
ncbi:MAG: hypothetical protein DRO12_01355 [Thermoprotei archaeon]|nr:MAG: hypothetical protein DRO12_01355 [Thermoprotei archaeon]